MKFAMYDYDGEETLLGVWVWDDSQPDADPEIAYWDEDQLRKADDMLSEFTPDEGQTWKDVMEYLAEKAHWQHHRRSLPIKTKRTAAQLLAEARAAA